MKAIKTKYNGTWFRSKLEASYAKYFDQVQVDWQYEVNGYHLPGCNYLPDFWMPKIKTFFEVKGPVTPGAEKACELAKEVEDNWFESEIIVVIGNEQGVMRMASGDDEVVLAKCFECKGRCFMGVSRSYTCRLCGAYDGDHHIEEWVHELPLPQIRI